MKTATRGNAAEGQILAALVLRGFVVLTPFGGGQSFDLVVHPLAVYLPADDSVYLLPVGLIPGHLGRLRLEPTKNNQQRGVRFATEFEIDRWSREKLRSLTA
jgi:hypothetical protein